MTGYYQQNPNYAPDDYSEDVERLARCEHKAGEWFNDATVIQAAVFNRKMADIAYLKGSPRWDREREKAMATFHETTKGAAAIYEMALKDLMLTGEISEATSHAYDALMVAGPPVPVVEANNVAYADFKEATRLGRSSRLMGATS